VRFDDQSLSLFTAENGLVENGVTSLLVDHRGRVWIGTVGGISCYDGAKWHAHTTEDGLVGNWVEGLFEDHNGHIWAAQEEALSRWDGINWVE
jgi:hypothetical protein